MDGYNVFCLGDYKFRRINLIGAASFLLADIIIHVFRLSHLWNGFLNVHIVLHFFLVLGLVSAVLSKEKIDDELAQKIRYASFKLTLGILVCIGAVIVYLLSFLKVTSIPLLPVIYFFEATLVLNLLLTYYGIRFSPAWILKEPTSPKSYTRLMIAVYTMIAIMLILLAIINTMLD